MPSLDRVSIKMIRWDHSEVVVWPRACVRDIGLTAFFTSGMIEVILEAKWAAKTLVQQARERASETNNKRSKEQ